MLLPSFPPVFATRVILSTTPITPILMLSFAVRFTEKLCKQAMHREDLEYYDKRSGGMGKGTEDARDYSDYS